MKRTSAERLYNRWATGEAVAVGREIFEPLTPKQQVDRGARVLGTAVAKVQAPPAVLQILDIARDASRWHEGHAAFSSVRDLTLAEERRPTTRQYAALLFVAENVAKTIYNASPEPVPFD